jgi:chlorophyll synthase
MASGAPSWQTVVIALLYGIGAHGIMTLNDFKALEGDRQMGVNSLPVTLGPERAAKFACWAMAVPQVFVFGLLLAWSKPLHGIAVLAVLFAQVLAMQVLLRNPRAKAPWYNGTGVGLYITGMMIAAFALRSIS